MTTRRKAPTFADLIDLTSQRLRQAKLAFAHGTTDPVAEAAFIVGETLGVSPGDLMARTGRRVSDTEQRRIEAVVRQRIRTRKPAAYLLKRIYMLGVPFYIDERAIVPRSYLGEIIADPLFAGGQYSLHPKPDAVRRILDLCTGSGCLAVLAAKRFPKATVDAVDLSDDALAVARRNVAKHRLGKRVRLHQGDLYSPVDNGRYDLILANPPYVDAKGMAALPPECRHEPRMALDGGRDGLAIVRRIIDGAARHLNPGGGLLCEIGRGRRNLERAYPKMNFLWLDTEASSGEVFWLGIDQLG